MAKVSRLSNRGVHCQGMRSKFLCTLIFVAPFTDFSKELAMSTLTSAGGMRQQLLAQELTVVLLSRLLGRDGIPAPPATYV
jgi:hypothetical protein